jgi:beta-lactamase class A
LLQVLLAKSASTRKKLALRMRRMRRLCVERIVPAFRTQTAIAAAVVVLVALALGAWFWLGRAPVPTPRASAPQAQRVVYAPPPIRPTKPAPEAFQRDLVSAAQGFPGDVGVAVFDVTDGWLASYQGDRAFPQQSVSKVWVAVGLLDQVDRGLINLASSLTIQRQDLSAMNEPIAALVKPTFTTTLDDLLIRAIRDSDNAANDLLINQAGGVLRIQSILAGKGVTGVRLGMDEKHLQAVINGLTWRPEYAGTSAISLARARLPLSVREATLANYVSHPIDGATPDGTVEGLAALAKGRLLTPASTEKLVGIMDKVRTGRRRLKGGLESGWMLAHKTGTGPDLRGASVGINDVGLLTAPDGHLYAVAVYIAHTRAPTPVRLAFMQRVSELVEAQWSGKAPPAAAPEQAQTIKVAAHRTARVHRHVRQAPHAARVARPARPHHATRRHRH